MSNIYKRSNIASSQFDSLQNSQKPSWPGSSTARNMTACKIAKNHHGSTASNLTACKIAKTTMATHTPDR
jgi:hypothetical protein